MKQFTPEARGAVIRGVRADLTLAEAAERAGLAVQTVRNSLTQGRAETGTPHALFAEAVDGAREDAQTADLTEAEFHEQINRSVRAGSIQAMRLWWQIHGEHAEAPQVPDELDALREQFHARRASMRDQPDRANGNGAQHG